MKPVLLTLEDTIVEEFEKGLFILETGNNN